MTRDEVRSVWKQAEHDAYAALRALSVAEGREPIVTGLSGWVFEQAIRWSLVRELKTAGLAPPIEEQVPFRGRARIDLLVGRVALEIKSSGFFGPDRCLRYQEYRAEVEARGWTYCYVTWYETQKEYRRQAVEAFGVENAFFLDDPGEWQRFVSRVRSLLS